MKCTGILLILTVVLVGVQHASATVIFEVDTKFQGSPGNLNPALLAEISDTGNPNEVKLVLKVNNAQQGIMTPAVQQWWYNIDPSLQPSLPSLNIVFQSGLKTGVWDDSVLDIDIKTKPGSETNPTAYKPDGDGFFDFFFTFSSDTNNPVNAFDGNDTGTFLLSGISGLSENSFTFTSEGTSGSATDLLSAARLDGVSGEWWADNIDDRPHTIPEPSSVTLAMMGIAMLTCNRRCRRRR